MGAEAVLLDLLDCNGCIYLDAAPSLLWSDTLVMGQDNIICRLLDLCCRQTKYNVSNVVCTCKTSYDIDRISPAEIVIAMRHFVSYVSNQEMYDIDVNACNEADN